ncbi:MAG: hypothetical protein ACRENE_03225, partial [Polyangiaceae bacterium]
HIEENGITVTFVTLECAGDCAVVQAVASGGNPPYSYAWSDGPIGARRTLCPQSTTAYTLGVTDTASGGEIPRRAETIQVPLAANVLVCADGGSDGGSCTPGSYAGTWQATGLVDSGSADAGGAASNPSGPLTLALAAGSTNGVPTLTPTNTIVFTWEVVAMWTIHLTGGLDCATGEFVAEDKMASYTGAGVSLGTCDFNVVGRYDPATKTIAGQWTSNCPNGDWGGDWTTTLSP